VGQEEQKAEACLRQFGWRNTKGRSNENPDSLAAAGVPLYRGRAVNNNCRYSKNLDI